VFVGRKVLDVWAESDVHHGGQSRFRDQHSARGKLNLAALRRIVSGKNACEAPRPTDSPFVEVLFSDFTEAARI
jgi:hypothetical protein